MEQEKEKNWLQGVGLTWALAISLATMIVPFIHMNIGRRFLMGPNVLGAFVLIFVCAAFGDDPYVPFFYFFAWTLMLVVRRLQTRHNVKRGAVIHSLWRGDSILRPLFKRSSVADAVGFLAVLGVAVVVSEYTLGLAVIMVAGLVGIVGVDWFNKALYARRREAMADAMIEVEHLYEGG